MKSAGSLTQPQRYSTVPARTVTSISLITVGSILSVSPHRRCTDGNGRNVFIQTTERQPLQDGELHYRPGSRLKLKCVSAGPTACIVLYSTRKYRSAIKRAESSSGVARASTSKIENGPKLTYDTLNFTLNRVSCFHIAEAGRFFRRENSNICRPSSTRFLDLIHRSNGRFQTT